MAFGSAALALSLIPSGQTRASLRSSRSNERQSIAFLLLILPKTQTFFLNIYVFERCLLDEIRTFFEQNPDIDF